MKSKILILFLGSLLLVGAVSPAMAAEEPVGERINVLIEEPFTYPAGEPFFVGHGWSDAPLPQVPIGRFGFTLEVDGVDQGKGSLLNAGPGLTGGFWWRWWVFNFPEGMPAGDVTFTGHWLAPCEWAVEWFAYPDTCRTPNAMVEVLTAEHTVTFT